MSNFKQFKSKSIFKLTILYIRLRAVIRYPGEYVKQLFSF